MAKTQEKKRFSWQIGCLWLIPLLYIISAACAYEAHRLWKENPPPPLYSASASPSAVSSASPQGK